MVPIFTIPHNLQFSFCWEPHGMVSVKGSWSLCFFGQSIVSSVVLGNNCRMQGHRLPIGLRYPFHSGKNTLTWGPVQQRLPPLSLNPGSACDPILHCCHLCLSKMSIKCYNCTSGKNGVGSIIHPLLPRCKWLFKCTNQWEIIPFAWCDFYHNKLSHGAGLWLAACLHCYTAPGAASSEPQFSWSPLCCRKGLNCIRSVCSALHSSWCTSAATLIITFGWWS